MSELKYPITQQYISDKWNQRPGGSRIPRYAVAHDTGNPGSTARQNFAYFNSRQLSASAHVFIDDKEILVMIPLTEKAYHVRSNVSDANDWAIGVELCYGGEINFREAYKRYVWFLAYLCQLYNWKPTLQIKGHYQLDPERRKDPVSALAPNGETWESFLADVSSELKGISLSPNPLMIRQMGDQGEPVVKLQQDLKELGFYNDAVDGIFGLKTKDAVFAFEQSVNLPADGIFGSKAAGALQAALEEKRAGGVLRRGDRGREVELIQRDLTALGYDTGEVDGIFGPATEKAVRQFQQKRKIKVDGAVGPVTKKALNEAVAEKAKENPAPVPEVPGPLPIYQYRVQIGVFRDKQNAENLQERARQAGFDAIIIAEPFAVIPPVQDLSIIGSSVLSAEQLDQFVKRVSPDAPLLGKYYIEFGKFYGLRGDAAFAQALLETDYLRFTGTVKRNQNNFAGLGATGPDNRGASFKTEREGVLAHLQHLFAYATTINLPPGELLVDPRFKFVKRGSSKTWEALNGKWAVPGNDYGETILKIYNDMKERG
jgi:peptidoglycan hydrolase-like protein with peptidoglycan-binding domain